MALGERTKKSTSPSLVTSSSSIKKSLDKGASLSKNEAFSKGSTKGTSSQSTIDARRSLEPNSSAGLNGGRGSPILTSPDRGTSPKTKNDSTTLLISTSSDSIGGEEINDGSRERELSYKSEDGAGPNYQRQPGGLRTTIGTAKFRASPILKNPKTQVQSPHRKEQDRPKSGNKNEGASTGAFYYNDSLTCSNGECSDTVSPDNEYGRWERNPNYRYWDGEYGRRPAPRIGKADSDEQEPLGAEAEEDSGPNLISPSKSHPPRFSDSIGHNRDKDDLERPSPRGRGQTKIMEIPSSTSKSKTHDRYSDFRCDYESPAGATSRISGTPYSYDNVDHHTPRRNAFIDGPSGIYQYSPVRTKSKDFESEERDLPSELLELARSPALTPRRKLVGDSRGDGLGDSPWRLRYGEFPAHSPSQIAWDVGCIATPRQPSHYSPSPSGALGFGYLTSPREGWGSSPFRSTGPQTSLSRADDSTSLPKWTDSPDGSPTTSPTKPVRSLFRETPKPKDEKLKPKPFIEKRSHPVNESVTHSPWSFVRSLGNSFEDTAPPKSPYGTPSRMHYKAHPGATVPPPLPADTDSYWGDYYGRYCPPPSRFSSAYPPARGWSSGGRHLPQVSQHRGAPLPHRPVATPAATPAKNSTSESGGSARARKNTDNVEPLPPVAVTPTSTQALALQQYGEAVEYSKNRLRELLILSSPTKSASSGDRNVPPWDIVPPADDNLLDEITSNDVLLGRGGGTNTQAGNKRFRAIVNAHQPMYLQARRKEKPLIARCIVEWIRLKNGRFLKKDEKSGKWHEVGDERAEAKTSQALREGLDVREKKSGVSCGGSVGSGSAAAPTSNTGSATKKKRKAKTPDSKHHPSDRRMYDPRHAGWGEYPPAHHPHYYGRAYYEASRRMRGRDDYGHGHMPPHAHHPYYHHPNAYGAHSAYPVPPADYRPKPKQMKWTESARSESKDYPPVQAVLSSDHEREKQYYRDFTPPPSAKREKLPVVAPSYDQGD